MNYELIAIVCLIICLILIAVELIWLYVLAEKHQVHARKNSEDSRKINAMFETILYHPTEEALQNEIATMKRFVGSDPAKMDTISSKIIGTLTSETAGDEQKAAVCALNETIRPLAFYIRMLHEGNTYEKAFACRKVAVFYEDSELPVIRKLAFSKNQDLSYNAAMALASFGDEDTLVRYILGLQKNYDYSFRIIMELMSTYNGDLRSLAKKILADCDEYIRATVIKGLSDKAFAEFEPVYLEGMRSSNPNIKIACVRALGKLGKPEYEHPLITAAHDKNWRVRSAAVKELGRLNTEKSKLALVEATKDTEWWVRYNAAKTLVECDPDLTYVESVLNGYDRYGADAVKYILYRTYNLQEDNQQ